MSPPTIPGGISCREVVEIVTAYLDGALGPEERARLEVHLELCGPCLEYVEQVRATARLAAAAVSELDVRPDRDAILRAFRDFRQGASGA